MEAKKPRPINEGSNSEWKITPGSYYEDIGADRVCLRAISGWKRYPARDIKTIARSTSGYDKETVVTYYDRVDGRTISARCVVEGLGRSRQHHPPSFTYVKRIKPSDRHPARQDHYSLPIALIASIMKEP